MDSGWGLNSAVASSASARCCYQQLHRTLINLTLRHVGRSETQIVTGISFARCVFSVCPVLESQTELAMAPVPQAGESPLWELGWYVLSVVIWAVATGRLWQAQDAAPAPTRGVTSWWAWLCAANVLALTLTASPLLVVEAMSCAWAPVVSIGLCMDALRLPDRRVKWKAGLCLLAALVTVWIAGAGSSAVATLVVFAPSVLLPALWRRYAVVPQPHALQDTRYICSTRRLACLVLVATAAAFLSSTLFHHAWGPALWALYASTAAFAAAQREAHEDAAGSQREWQVHRIHAEATRASPCAVGAPACPVTRVSPPEGTRRSVQRVGCLFSYNVHGMPVDAPHIMCRPSGWHSAVHRVYHATSQLHPERMALRTPHKHAHPFVVTCIQEVWGHRAGLAWPLLFIASLFHNRAFNVVAQCCAVILGPLLPWVLWDNKIALLRGGRPCSWHGEHEPQFDLHSELRWRQRSPRGAVPFHHDGRPTPEQAARSPPLFAHCVGLHGHSMTWHPRGLIDAGLLIASTHAPTLGGFTPYHCRDSETVAHKGYMWAYWHEHRTLVVNTHLVGTVGAPLYTDTKQVQQLTRGVEALLLRFSHYSDRASPAEERGERGGDPTLNDAPLDVYIAGDFNYSDPSHKDFNGLRQLGFRRVSSSRWGTVNPPGNTCLDHVFFLRHACCSRVPAEPCGDTDALQPLQPLWPGWWDQVSDHAMLRLIPDHHEESPLRRRERAVVGELEEEQ